MQQHLFFIPDPYLKMNPWSFLFPPYQLNKLERTVLKWSSPPYTTSLRIWWRIIILVNGTLTMLQIPLTCYCRGRHEPRSQLVIHTDIFFRLDEVMPQPLQNRSTIVQYYSTLTINAIQIIIMWALEISFHSFSYNELMLILFFNTD